MNGPCFEMLANVQITCLIKVFLFCKNGLNLLNYHSKSRQPSAWDHQFLKYFTLNSEYWPLKLIKGRKLWSVILEIHDSQRERPNFSLLFLPVQAKIRNCHSLFLSKNGFQTGQTCLHVFPVASTKKQLFYVSTSNRVVLENSSFSFTSLLTFNS